MLELKLLITVKFERSIKMLCKNCSKEIGKGSVFCNFCGTSQLRQKKISSNQECEIKSNINNEKREGFISEEKISQSRKSKKINFKSKSFIILVVIITLMIILLITFLVNNSLENVITPSTTSNSNLTIEKVGSTITTENGLEFTITSCKMESNKIIIAMDVKNDNNGPYNTEKNNWDPNLRIFIPSKSSGSLVTYSIDENSTYNYRFDMNENTIFSKANSFCTLQSGMTYKYYVIFSVPNGCKLDEFVFNYSVLGAKDVTNFEHAYVCKLKDY
jgi:hypothetical protein